MLDMVGKPCPVPVIEAKKALRDASPGTRVTVLVDNDIARQNLEKMAAGLGHDCAYADADAGRIVVTITAGSREAAERNESGLVVAVGCDRMGEGSEELGRILMKSFIYSLTELEARPEHMLFFNSGVRLAVEGSGALADLGALAGKGTAILVCGACLEYYQLTGELKAGTVTNMFAIATIMSQAKKLINL